MGQVQLQFGVFNFQTAFFGCSGTAPFVSIYDGSTTSDPSLGRYCGNENGIYTPPDVILSSSGSLLVHFYSGAYGLLLPGQGFATTFSFPDYAECADVMCLNGGTCTDTPTGYSCSCAAGFTGLQCETDDVDHCASSPCTKGGTCVDRSNGFQCLCPPGYVGTRCQVSKSSCLLPLGMANGDIEDNHISASSEKSGYEAYMGRLNGPRAWQPTVANTNQWLQVKFNNRTIITGIQTQGLWGGHVKSYRLLYGDTEDGLSVYTETGSDSANVFDANSDGPTVVSHDLDRPFIASIVRVNPQDFTSALIRLRVEVLGCEESLESIQPGTTTPIATTALSTFKAITTEDEQPTLPPSTQSRTAEMSATTLSQTTTALPTSQPNTMFSQTTSSLSPPVLTTTQPTDATTSVTTTQPTLPPSTQSETIDFSTTSLIQILTSAFMTHTPSDITTTTTTLVTPEIPPKSSFMTTVETAETTTVAPLTTTALLTSPVLETLATTAAVTTTSIQTMTLGDSSTMKANTAPVTTPGM
ncbi:uncharacterized protein LOC144914193 [Branchiostoma floridae x Branchiostoma belcheri]